jgi:hypothetical protein
MCCCLNKWQLVTDSQWLAGLLRHLPQVSLTKLCVCVCVCVLRVTCVYLLLFGCSNMVQAAEFNFGICCAGG